MQCSQILLGLPPPILMATDRSWTTPALDLPSVMLCYSSHGAAVGAVCGNQSEFEVHERRRSGQQVCRWAHVTGHR